MPLTSGGEFSHRVSAAGRHESARSSASADPIDPRIAVRSLGVLVVHHIAPEVFGGYETSANGIALATPAKAVFDMAYLSATHGRRFRHLPEVRLGRGYRSREARAWVARIPSARLRAITLDRIEVIENAAAHASVEPGAF